MIFVLFASLSLWTKTLWQSRKSLGKWNFEEEEEIKNNNQLKDGHISKLKQQALDPLEIEEKKCLNIYKQQQVKKMKEKKA